MRKIIFISFLLLSTIIFSQEKEPTYKERLRESATKINKEFVKTPEYAEFKKQLSEDLKDIKRYLNELDKLELKASSKKRKILILTVKKKSIKWYRFKQKSFYRKQINKLKK